MAVERIRLNKNRNGVRVLYRTDDTRELDEAFRLQGQPLDIAETRALVAKVLGIGLPSAESEVAIPYFVDLAGRIGFFAGVAEEEIPSETVRSYLRKPVTEGYLERFEYDSVAVISPTRKLAMRSPFAER